MTGSHNLGFKASSKNDDNLMIIQGNAPLAAAYAANIIAIYQAYRWNAYVEEHRQDPKVWHGLVDRDDWQNDYLAGDELAELTFWMGSYQPAAAAAAAAMQPPDHVPKHTPQRKIAAARKTRSTKTSSRKSPKKSPKRSSKKSAAKAAKKTAKKTKKARKGR
jgi:hypothetical protein